jgi:hypothetical protein
MHAVRVVSYRDPDEVERDQAAAAEEASGRPTAEVGGGAPAEFGGADDWDVTGSGAVAPQIAAGLSAPSGATNLDWAAEGGDWASEPHKDFTTAAATGNPDIGNAAAGWD